MDEHDKTDWRHRAACRDEDPELFFPISDMGPGARQAEQAKAVCARCPVRSECLNYALNNGLNHGIFGGMTERERHQFNRTSHSRSRAA
ncbi:transcription factor WhiB [Halopolyspora algeriensis]|uniref:Transcriptional regulator WhiB n=1 Tax=Halopolyspora algeriensis TaxID=1500506 RepID=A0A368VW61_9ACTN|nr:WhiB family transcriptional regulator [Halopolyspora algeriensis]RCW46115.1 transcription factor WhiB [Halopolyspora algeriensis]TQM55518.1 transcription factor WhiB [Halopolyspora algeriensis]